jgi:hypothetical protein
MLRGPDRDHHLRSLHCELSQGESRPLSLQVSADCYPVHTLRQCCKTFRCRVALPFPVATIRAPYGFVVASLLIVLVCFSRVPCLVRSRALPNPDSVAPLGRVRPSLFTGTPIASLSGRSVRLAAKLSGFIAAGDRDSQGATIEGVF